MGFNAKAGLPPVRLRAKGRDDIGRLGLEVGQRLAVIAFMNGQAVLDGVGRCTRPEAGEEAGLISRVHVAAPA